MKLVYVDRNRKPITDTRIVSEAFKLGHETVREALRDLRVSAEFALRNFKVDPKRDSVSMTEQGFIMLTMNFAGREIKEAFAHAFENVRLVHQPSQTPKSNRLYTATQVAKDAGLSANKLNAILQDAEIIYGINGDWFLHPAYRNKGIARQMSYEYQKEDGEIGTSYWLKWTDAGKAFVRDLLASKNVLSIKEGA